MAYPTIADGRLRLRLQLAAACAGIAIALLFIAVKFQTKDYLASRPAANLAGRHYSRMWFDAQNRLVGASRNGNRLTVERWDGGSVPAATREFTLTGADGSNDVPWAIFPDLSATAWIASRTLYLQAAGIPAKITLAGQPAPLALTILSDGSAAVAFADGSAGRWRISTGESLGARQLEPKDPDQAVAAGDYLALASIAQNRLVLYRFVDQKDWTIAEQSSAPYPPYRLVIPAPGEVAAFTAGGLRIENATRNSPGPLSSVASHLSDIVAAGEFDRIFVLPPDGDFYPLADGPHNPVVAASETRLAVSAPAGSGQNGTALLELYTDARLTTAGRGLSFAAGAFLLAGLFLLTSGFLRKGVRQGLRAVSQKQLDAPVALPDPPPDLVEAIASGRAVLFAGAGLSAQAGFPTRSGFIASVLQEASVDDWLPGPRLQKLATMVSRGEAEAAVSELATSIGREVRTQLIAHHRSVYFRFAVPSRSHQILARLPLASAITTNFDRLLEAMPQDWAATAATLQWTPPPDAEPCFLLRLFGDLNHAPSALLCEAEFETALQRSPVTPMIQHMLGAQTMVFIGCSLEGLLSDLPKIGPPGQGERKHFAVAGVSSAAWRKQVQELSERYGIEVLACGAEQIAAQLPIFLERLANAVDRARGGAEAGKVTEAAAK